MLAEAAQELDPGERHDALLVAVRVVFPSEAYRTTVDAEQTLVADGDAVCIAAEIPQHTSGFTEGGRGIDQSSAVIASTFEATTMPFCPILMPACAWSDPGGGSLVPAMTRRRALELVGAEPESVSPFADSR